MEEVREERYVQWITKSWYYGVQIFLQQVSWLQNQKLLSLCLSPILRSLGLFTVGQNKWCLFTPVVRLMRAWEYFVTFVDAQ